MLKFRFYKFKSSKDQRGAYPSPKKMNEKRPPDKRWAVLESFLVISVMIQSQAALSFSCGVCAGWGNFSCYARYAKNAYLVDKKFKSLPDCGRRFSPNEQNPPPFLFVKTLAVPDHDFQLVEKRNNLDLLYRSKDVAGLLPSLISVIKGFSLNSIITLCRPT